MRWRWGVIYHEVDDRGNPHTHVRNFRLGLTALRWYRRRCERAVERDTQPGVTKVWVALVPVFYDAQGRPWASGPWRAFTEEDKSAMRRLAHGS